MSYTDAVGLIVILFFWLSSLKAVEVGLDWRSRMA
jgi:hypothetical protein